MRKYFIPHEKFREALLKGRPAGLRDLEEALRRGTLVELRCPLCGELHLSELRFLSPLSPCPRCASRPSPAEDTGDDPGAGPREGDTRVTVLVPVLRGHPLLHLCLGAILRSLGKEGELMVSLAKPGSVPGRYLENIPCRKLENPGGTGLPAAVNQALLEARGDYLAVVREDVLVRPDWLRHLLSALESDPGALAASALILDMDGNICHAGYRPSRTPDGKPLLLPLRKGERPSSVEGTDEVPALALYCALLRRRPALETGFLDEEGYLPPGTYGDVDWTLRARLYGFRFLVVHASQALRLGSMSAAESPVHDESSLRNLDFLLQRWSHAEGAFPLSIAEEASPPSSQVSRSGVHAQSSR